MVDDTNQVIEQEIIQEEPAEQLSEQQPESDKERNFRAIREKADRMQRERDEAYRLIKEYEAEATKKVQEKSQDVAPDEDFNLGPDDLAEGKHLSKVVNKIKYLENELKNYKQQSSSMTAESRLQNKYTDFYQVVNQTNIEMLKEQYPSIASTIANNADVYSAGESAYLFIKKLGLAGDSYEADRATAQRNAAKPRPLSSVSPQQGESPLTRANAFTNGLTDDLRRQLHKEMIDAMKNR